MPSPAASSRRASRRPRWQAFPPFSQYAGRSLRRRQVALRELSSAFADSLLRQFIEGEPFLVRLAARTDGDRIFVLMGILLLRPRHLTSRKSGVSAIASADDAGRPPWRAGTRAEPDHSLTTFD